MHVFNIPSSAPFLRTLIEALADGRLIPGFEARTQPERLASATLYFPTRRAGRLARDIFLDVFAADAVLLPRIVVLGDIDEDELAFAQAAHPADVALDAAPSLDGLERRLTLARLIASWTGTMARARPDGAAQIIGGPAAALALADDLVRLMDDMTTRGVSWDALDSLVPSEYDDYWQLTLGFLKIARTTWPAYLAERGRMEPAKRRDLLIKAEAERLKARANGPVIAAGSTGSMPATADFLREIARLPDGAVVLPGLDTDLDDDAWASIGGISNASGEFTTPPSVSHPQFALHALLARFDIQRGDVVALAPRAPFGREVLLSEVMRPANATAQWHQRLKAPGIAKHLAAGLNNLCVVQTANPEMEALAIAIAMREAQHEGAAAALVTPDRALARRVMAALGRWHLVFDDSGGDALTDTAPGLFARLIADTVADHFAPAPLLALLKHPLLRLGQPEGAMRDTVNALEMAVLRGPRPPSGLDGLAREFALFTAELAKLKAGATSLLHRSEPRAKLDAAALGRAQAMIELLRTAMAPLLALDPDKPHDFADLAHGHRAVIAALSRSETGDAAALSGAEGSALAAAFDDVAENRPSGLAVTFDDYPEVFLAAFGNRVVRRPAVPHASLRIYGTLDARLTDTDRVILGGLVEGVWPPAPRTDPWLNRPMRQKLGLDLPERRIGLSAHDFAQLLGAPRVILTHAAKAGGAPAVASRFLHRLEAVAGDRLWRDAVARGNVYAGLADALDRPPGPPEPIQQPNPRPPVATRPMALSVTEIEHWLRDPYTIYAKHILKLAPLEPVDMPLSAADRGSAIHNALADYTKSFPSTRPDDAARILREFGAQHFAPLMNRTEARALWWPRFLRIADWFAGWDTARRADLAGIESEIQGSLSIALGERQFRLFARADRIERRNDGTYAIVDYKTGLPPTGKQVRLGLSPQLTLEAAILRSGGFGDIPANASVCELLYVRLSGNDPAGDPRPIDLSRDKRSEDSLSPDEGADDALRKLEQLVRTFDDEKQPYTSLKLSMWTTRYGDYDDLARIKEWSAAGNGTDES